MTTWARNVGNVAVDVTTTDPATIFHPEVAAQFITVPAGTLTGATWNGTKWTNPAPPGPPAPAPYAVLSPMQFYLAFAPAERVAIKKSTDPVVMEFWATYELAAQTGSQIDPNLVSVQSGLAYLSTTNQVPAVAPAAPYIAPARVTQILAGIPQ